MKTNAAAENGRLFVRRAVALGVEIFHSPSFLYQDRDAIAVKRLDEG
ncbi:hypothetical protein [Bacillus litorisediminis]|nr:hypothetical protein [Bacillus litorisediminis]